ncbi:hypothetical protein BDW69DRAFT_181246 [Aspergillus filifer]
MLLSVSLASKLSNKGLVPVSLHPGVIRTGLANSTGENRLASLAAFNRVQGHSLFWLDDWSGLIKSLAQGIATHVFAAFHDSITTDQHNGTYLDDSKPAPAEKIYPWGRDPVDAESL